MAKPIKARAVQRAKASGRCVRCQRQPAQEGFTYCADCRAQQQAIRKTPEGRAHAAAYQRAWNKANPERVRQKVKEYQHRVKAAVIAKLGGRCTCCGESEPAFLSLDHVNKDGKRHRDMFPKNLDGYWRDLRKGEHGFEVQVLCFNCHMAKDYRGGCPHQR